MVDFILEQFEIPLDAWADVRITKKLFEENAGLNKLDLKIFLESVEQIRLAAQINAQTARINSYKDEERDYSELALIAVELRKGSYEKVCRVIHAAIPYPTLVFVHKDREFAISIAKKRTNKNDTTKAIVDDVAITAWLKNGTSEQELLFGKMKFSALETNDMLCIIDKLFSLIKLHPLACGFGCYPREDKISEALELKEELESISGAISEVQGKMKKEKAFGRRVELNVKLKHLEKQREEYQGRLRGLE